MENHTEKYRKSDDEESKTDVKSISEPGRVKVRRN